MAGGKDTQQYIDSSRAANEADETQREDTQKRIQSLLRRSPSGPDFPESTVRYCQESTRYGLARFEEVLVPQHPASAQMASEELRIMREGFVALPPSNLSVENGRLFLQVPNSRSKFPARGILQTVYRANKHLGAFRYAIGLFPPVSPRNAHQRWPGFNMRFSNILKTGEWPVDSAHAKIMAVAYLTQIAKISAVNNAKKFLERANNFSGVAHAEKIAPYLTNEIQPMVHHLREDEVTVTEGLTTINNIAEQQGLNEEQVLLLLDLAFIKGKAFDQYDEFLQVFRSVVQFISNGDWEQAFIHRDFLLKYFSGSFPEWRKVAYEREKGGSFESMKQIIQAAKKGDLVMTEEEVPSAYRHLFGDALKNKIEHSIREDELRTLRDSVSLSNRILRLITARHGDYFMLPEHSGALEVEAVTLKHNMQVCPIPESSRSAYFGRVLYNQIRNAQQADIKEPRFNRTEEILDTIRRAYYAEIHQNPALNYTLSDYLEVLIRSAKEKFASDDPVQEFIGQLKEPL